MVVQACAANFTGGNQGPGLALVEAGSVTVRDCRLIGNGGGPVGEST